MNHLLGFITDNLISLLLSSDTSFIHMFLMLLQLCFGYLCLVFFCDYQSISEPISDGDLVYKFNRIVGKPNLSDQFKMGAKRYKKVGYNLDIMQQTTCTVLNTITVYSYGFLFNCIAVGQASDTITSLT